MLHSDTRLDPDWSKPLSPREREVALLVARGLTNKEIAGELRLSDGTVKLHVHNIFLKLGARKRHMLIYMVSQGEMREQYHGVRARPLPLPLNSPSIVAPKRCAVVVLVEASHRLRKASARDRVSFMLAGLHPNYPNPNEAVRRRRCFLLELDRKY
jgi:DNA-binding CsgD family transcriptional regulator